MKPWLSPGITEQIVDWLLFVPVIKYWQVSPWYIAKIISTLYFGFVLTMDREVLKARLQYLDNVK